MSARKKLEQVIGKNKMSGSDFQGFKNFFKNPVVIIIVNSILWYLAFWLPKVPSYSEYFEIRKTWSVYPFGIAFFYTGWVLCKVWEFFKEVKDGLEDDKITEQRMYEMHVTLENAIKDIKYLKKKLTDKK